MPQGKSMGQLIIKARCSCGRIAWPNLSCRYCKSALCSVRLMLICTDAYLEDPGREIAEEKPISVQGHYIDIPDGSAAHSGHEDSHNRSRTISISIPSTLSQPVPTHQLPSTESSARDKVLNAKNIKEHTLNHDTHCLAANSSSGSMMPQVPLLMRTRIECWILLRSLTRRMLRSIDVPYGHDAVCCVGMARAALSSW